MVAVCLLVMSVACGKVGGGGITFSVKGAGNVVYSRVQLVMKTGQKCSDCHYNIFRMATLNKQATMTDMQSGKSCGACHNGRKAFTIEANCKKCHT